MIFIALRPAAVLIALLGVLDPAFETSRPRRVPVRFELTTPPDSERATRGKAIRQRLSERLRDVIAEAGPRAPEAVVIVGDTVPDALLPGRLPVSTVSLAADLSPNVRIVRLDDPPPAALRQSIPIAAEFEATGMRGATSVLTIADRGVVVDRVQHTWSKDRERYRASMAYAPPGAGLHVVRVSAEPTPAERTAADNLADVALLVEGRPLRVLAFDPRPSWNATFVRRALEADARFQVDSIARSARGVTVRSRHAPPALAGDPLHEFDAVIVGAPEDLRPAEMDALSRFARRRGGAVVFLPDRRPSGVYAGVLPAAAFEEALVETPVRLTGTAPAVVRASELLVARDPSASATALAAIDRRGARAPVSVSWTHGAGRMILWGALDAWRYRADDGDGFARYWRAAMADLALGAPAPMTVSVAPRIAAVHERVVVRAMVRATEYGGAGSRIELPAVSASLVSERGHEQVVRLWPTAEVGVFEGRVTPFAPGNYDVIATAGSHADRAAVAVMEGPQRVVEADAPALRLIAESTGGVHVSLDDLAPLEAHLRGLAGATEQATVRPMRSFWWFLPFAGSLTVEWALRRRRGLK
jgi:hypothetical protein